jgi:molybdopterin synthase sulfur carrier subunit
MAITFHIPGALREFTGGQSTVEVEVTPATVADALSALWTLYPGVRDRIANEQGQIREHINVFVGNENIRYTGGLRTSLAAGAAISIVPAVSGGSDSGDVVPNNHSSGNSYSSRRVANPSGNTPNPARCQ